MVAGPGFEPGTFGLCVPLQLSLLPAFGGDLWSGLYLHPVRKDEGARRLVSTPSPLVAGLGSVSPVKASPTLTGVTRLFPHRAAQADNKPQRSLYASDRGFLCRFFASTKLIPLP